MSNLRTERKTGAAFPSPYKFKRHGQSGTEVSDIFPHTAKCVDDIAVIRSMHADVPNHEPSLMLMNCGEARLIRPSVGSWVTYGLGSENQNLPGFVVMLSKKGGPISGAKNWTSGYMPASYQGTVVKASGTPILDLARPAGVTREAQRRLLDQLNHMNSSHLAQHPTNSNLAARIASYELAFNMQKHAPEAVDFNQESDATRELYGVGEARTDDFGRKLSLIHI